MNCSFENELTAYLDEELSPSDKASLTAHLPGCHSCQATLRLLQTTIGRVEAMPPLSSPLQLRSLPPATGSWQRVGWFGGAGVAAAAALLLFLRIPAPSPGSEVTEGWHLELAGNVELVRDLDVAGLSELEDVDVIEHLDELETQR